jgi:hypothetical protein
LYKTNFPANESLRNYLITNDKLIVILYRLDVSEAQVHKLLNRQPGNLASDSIAKLIIERQ